MIEAARDRWGPVHRRASVWLLAAAVVAACGDPASPVGPSEEAPDAASTSRGQPAVVPIEGLGGSITVAADVNESLQVAGTAETDRGDSRAFLWDDGETRELGTLGGSWSTASDLNDWGQVTGTSVTDGGEARAFFWASGTMYEIGTLGGRESHGVAINDRGQVAGYSTTADGEVHAFLWSHGRMHDLGTLGGSGSFTAATNDRGDVVGRSVTEDGAAQAFLWSGGEIAGLAPSPARSSSAVDVSAEGHVLVNARDGKRGRAHVWFDGIPTSLETPEGGTAVATAINGNGHAVGQISVPSGRTWAVLWQEDGSALLLHSRSHSGSSTAAGINDAGTVAGALRPHGSPGLRAFVWSDGGIRTLEPGALDRRPESTSGVSVTESGVVLGLATYASGAVRSFLWRPEPPSRAGDPAEGDDVGNGSRRFSLQPGAPGAPGASGDASSGSPAPPLSSGSRMGRALRGIAPEAERPELAWPRSVAALLDE